MVPPATLCLVKPICAFDRVTVTAGDEPTRYEAELYLQSPRNYVIGRLADWVWWRVIEIAPWTRPERDRKSFGWRLRFELWASYERPQKGRTYIGCVPLSPEQAAQADAMR